MYKNRLKTIYLLLMVIFAHSLNAQFIDKPNEGFIESDYYFYSPDGMKKFKLDASKIAIKFDAKMSKKEHEAFFNQFPELISSDFEVNHEISGLTIVDVKNRFKNQKEYDDLKGKLKSKKKDLNSQPMLVYEDGTKQLLSNKVIIKLKSSKDLKQLEKDSKSYGFAILKKYEYDELVYFVQLDDNSGMNALQLANILTEKNNYASAEPDFIKLMNKFNTNDPNLAAQWALNNTGTALQYNGTPGADMNVFSAWSINTGTASIKVAVIDEGVDLNHPDLIANLLPGFDATGLGSNGGPQGNDAHGTACAGIIAAVANNSIGAAGVAYGTKIVPIRIAYGSGNNWVTNDSWISAGIDWAWNQGQADVLSNSWGGGSSSTLINDAIGRAVTLGRGNKGSAVLFSAANNNTPVAAYPASNNNTIAVIASSMCDQRKSPTSCDGETFWGSNYGTHCDVAAPGVKIYTTDISGPAGYSAGDYTPTFNGTSSACPNAAAVMALIYSVNPNLTYAQARTILESTCEKVGGYGYNANVSGQPNGAWSQDLGYGRVNAFYALQLASNTVCNNAPIAANTISSNNNFCFPQNVTMTLDNTYPLTGITYQWQQSSNGSTYNDISGATSQTYTIFTNFTKHYRCIISCGSNSITSTPKLVTFVDNTIVNFPHTEKFPGSTLPCGWSVQNVNADAKTWVPIQSTYRSPTYCMYYNRSTTLPADDWIFSAPIAMTAGQSYGVRFFYRSATTTQPEKLEVKWGASPNAASMTSSAIFSNTNITNVLYTGANTATITPSTTGIYYVGFRVFSNANMGSMFLEDVTFDVVAPCNTPLLAGTISGPSTIEAGNSSLSTWTVTGNTGTDLTWQQSSNGGTTWTNLPALVTPFITTFIAAPGNYLWRTEVTSYNCPPAYSTPFAVTVTPRQGDFFSNPIVASKYFVQEFSNSAQSGYGSDYTGPNAQPSNDLFFRYTTSSCVDSLLLSTCTSGFDTYVHILDANGAHIFSIDDGTLCGQTPVFKIPVSPNTVYHFVVEGWNTSNGQGIFGGYEIVNGTANPTITSSSGSNIICPNQTVTLTASAGSSYAWITGETTQSIVVSYPDIYSVTVYDSNNCGSSAEITLVAGNATTWYRDADGDGFGNINVTLSACSQPSGYVANNTDCDDNNAAINVSFSYFIDADGDGFGSTTTAMLCSATAPSGYSTNNTDCDDNNAAVNTTTQYFIDADGDGFGSTTTAMLCSATAPSGYATNNTDCDDNNAAINVSFSYYIDADGDGFGSTTSALLCSATAPAGYSTNNTDCDDNNTAVNTTTQYFVDADGDGFGSTTSALLCSATAPSGYSANNTDCDDNNAAVNTTTQYFVDADGDGFGSTTSALLCSATAPSGYATNNTDCDDNNAAIGTPQTWYLDNDGDGFGQIEYPLVVCNQPSGYVSNFTDCDDNNAAINTPNLFYADSDQDGFGGSIVGSFCLVTPPPYWSINNNDCNDNNAAINPNATEICGNNTDDNCNGLIDETCCNIIIQAIVTNAYCSNVSDGSINLTISNGLAPYTFTWSNGASTEDLNNLSVGSYTVTVTDANNCITSAIYVVNHNNQIPASPTTINGPSGACRNQTNVVFSVTSIPGATSYIWTLPSGASGSSTTNSISVSFSNSYNTGNLCVRAINACGQSAQFCRQVLRYTNAPGTPGIISGRNRGVCPNTTYSYSIAAVNNATSYTWTPPANASIVSGQGTTNVTVSFNANFGTSGVLTVRASNCIGNGGNRNLSIQRSVPQPSTITGPSTICPFQQGLVYSVVNDPDYTYNWVVQSGCTIVSGQGTHTVTVNWNGSTGSIGVQAVNICAVSSFRSKSINVVTCSTGSQPAASAYETSFNVYPNPSSGLSKVYFTTDNETPYTLEVFNIQGKLMQRINGISNKGDNYIDLELTNSVSGMYFIKYRDNNNHIITKNLIVE